MGERIGDLDRGLNPFTELFRQPWHSSDSTAQVHGIDGFIGRGRPEKAEGVVDLLDQGGGG